MITENKNGRVTQIFTVKFDHSVPAENKESSELLNKFASKASAIAIISSTQVEKNDSETKNKYL